MVTGSYRFDRFVLDPGDRLLRRDGAPVEISSRYFDALALLVREQGKLVSKDRFLEEVWRGVPVTDEALTQCVRALRRCLGDDAGRPRFIETVPRHGYRFIAEVQAFGADEPASRRRPSVEPVAVMRRRRLVMLASAGMIGGGGAGLLGGLLYGLLGASQPLEPGMGAASVLLVLTCLTILVGLMGGAAVGIGVAASGFVSGRPGPWSIVGGAVGGLIVGGVTKGLGLDAFHLLFGRSPGDITGAPEGLVLGGAVGLGAWLAERGGAAWSLRRSMAIAGLCGAAAGGVIPLFGGRLMAGSLDLLAGRFTGSRLRLDQIGALFGETGFGPVSQVVTGVVEGCLFSACVVGALILAGRSLEESG